VALRPRDITSQTWTLAAATARRPPESAWVLWEQTRQATLWGLRPKARLVDFTGCGGEVEGV
jgi:hypothetical protein